MHALNHGATNVLVRTVDSDVVVILINQFGRFVTIVNECWIYISFGTGKNKNIIDVRNIYNALGPRRSCALPVWMALTGCFCSTCTTSARLVECQCTHPSTTALAAIPGKSAVQAVHSCLQVPPSTGTSVLEGTVRASFHAPWKISSTFGCHWWPTCSSDSNKNNWSAWIFLIWSIRVEQAAYWHEGWNTLFVLFQGKTQNFSFCVK